MKNVAMPYLRNLLINEFAIRQSKNRAFSVRAFARKLQINHSALSEIMNGKRVVSIKMAHKIARQLMFDPEQTQQLLTFFKPQKTAKKSEISFDALKQTRQLSIDQFKAISEWHHFALLSLIETKNFRYDVKWMAQRLRMSEHQVLTALERLERMHFIKIHDSTITLLQESVAAPDGFSSQVMRKAHSANLDLAQDSLDRDPLEVRDFSYMTMAIDPQKIPQARKLLREFRSQLCELLQAGEKTEVYTAVLQLFPISNYKGDFHENKEHPKSGN